MVVEQDRNDQKHELRTVKVFDGNYPHGSNYLPWMLG